MARDRQPILQMHAYRTGAVDIICATPSVDRYRLAVTRLMLTRTAGIFMLNLCNRAGSLLPRRANSLLQLRIPWSLLLRLFGHSLNGAKAVPDLPTTRRTYQVPTDSRNIG